MLESMPHFALPRTPSSHNSSSPMYSIMPDTGVPVSPLIYGDPLFETCENEEKELGESIAQMVENIEKVGCAIKTLELNRESMIKEMEAKRMKQEECVRRKEFCKVVIMKSWLEMARKHQLSITELNLTAILPTELLIYIFTFLTPYELVHNVGLVSHKWNQLSFDSVLWRGICLKKNIVVSPPANLNWIRKNKPRSPSLTCRSPLFSPSGDVRMRLSSPLCSPSSLNSYVCSYRRELNWLAGKCANASLKGHKEIVWSLHYVPEDNSLISGSEDMTVKVWDLDEGICTQTLRGHKNGTICLARIGRRVFSGSADGSVKVWDLDAGVCLHTIQTHSSVWSLQIIDQGRKIFAGCVDASIKLFDVETGETLQHFRGHSAPVRCLQIAEGFGGPIVSGSYDRSIKMWDMNGNCVNTIRAHTHKINCLQLQGDTMVSGSHDTLVKVWDMNGNCINTLKGHDNMIHCLQFRGDKLLTGSSDNSIRVWNVKTGEHLQTFKNPSAVCALQFDSNLLMSGFEDSSIQIYDFSANI
eukprot:TRINITY_DN1921_c0_g2_i1.p1 TRINITY_DN1921_c0_g2~~TRINITY_DN1921_c0_g2_i1.p1  ORF type:complete len:528 (-),score=49.02 TRINITY_DN1921_c0_g2_i1:412-1995(-)